MTIILDNGHGNTTPGKRSPVWKDGTQLFEWEFARDVVRRISRKLNAVLIDNVIIVPEIGDVSLSERVKRTNEICKNIGAKNCLFVSIHANAGGGTGWEAFTTKGQTNSDKFCTILYEEAEKKWGKKWKIRKDSVDGDPDKEADYTVIKGAACPAVLVENFFMDTETDCKYINTETGREDCADVVVSAVQRWVTR